MESNFSCISGFSLFPFTILENIIDNDDLDINKINNVIRLVGLEEK